VTWTRLPAEFVTDPVLLALPRGVRLLHVEALCWSNGVGTDGSIPTHVLSRLTDEPEPREAAGQLVAAGLWTVTPEGWTIARFLDAQPSADDVKESARLNALRTKRWRYHREGRHDLCSPERCDAARDAARAAARPTDRPSDRKGGQDGKGGTEDASQPTDQETSRRLVEEQWRKDHPGWTEP
jgi:hypothetical protein